MRIHGIRTKVRFNQCDSFDFAIPVLYLLAKRFLSRFLLSLFGPVIFEADNRGCFFGQGRVILCIAVQFHSYD